MTLRTPSRVVLSDGRSVLVRSIEPSDADHLRAMHRRLSAATVVRRFFAPLPELGERQAARFCDVDGNDRAAVVGVDACGDLLGVARYDRLPGTRDAEVAVVVQDDHQHLGLGTALLGLLTAHARERGMHNFTADVLADNGRMFATFRDAHLVGTTDYDHGVVHAVLPLPRTSVVA